MFGIWNRADSNKKSSRLRNGGSSRSLLLSFVLSIVAEMDVTGLTVIVQLSDQCAISLLVDQSGFLPSAGIFGR